MKKIILIGMAIMMLGLLSSCAPKVSQEEYDKVASNLTEARTEILALQDDLSTADDELFAVVSKLEDAEERLIQVKAMFEVIRSEMLATMTIERYGMTDAEAAMWLLEFSALIEAVGDSELSARFDSYIDCATTYDYYSDAYADAESSFYTYLFDSMLEGLEID